VTRAGAGRRAARARRPAAGRRTAGRAQSEQPQRPFLLEVQRAGDRAADPPGPPAELGDLGPGRRIGHDLQAERQGRGADVVAPLDGQPERDRIQIALGELPVRGPRPGPAARRAQQRQQPEGLPVAQHPGRCAEDPGRLRDAHDS
jgi:hypothetical protein